LSIVFIAFSLRCFIGKYLRYIGIVVGSGIVFLTFFILIAKAFPDAFPNRVDTWISRIDNFTSDKPEDDYQIEKAKIAIASGKIYGLGQVKVFKKTLPQSSSDFILPSSLKEYGLVGLEYWRCIYYCCFDL
jgi:cell division protein FtsW